MTSNPNDSKTNKQDDRPPPLQWLLVLTLPFIGTLVMILLSLQVWRANIGGP